MTKTIDDIKRELRLENKEFEDMTDRDLCTLYEEFRECLIYEFMEEYEFMEAIVDRARYLAICKEIYPEDIWLFGDGYDNIEDLWNDLDQFEYDQGYFIQDCIELIRDCCV